MAGISAKKPKPKYMNACRNEVYAVILAAGSSSRLGRPKQLLEWRERPLLQHALLSAAPIFEQRIVVVLGAHAETIRAGIDFAEARSIDNPDWQEGMASSIRAGVQALPASAAAALFLLCDQPLVTSAHLQNLLQAWQTAPHCIVASHYRQACGVPALFPAEYFAHLLSLKGDRGAKPLFKQFQDSLLKIPLPEAELDIDSQADFERLNMKCF